MDWTVFLMLSIGRLFKILMLASRNGCHRIPRAVKTLNRGFHTARFFDAGVKILMRGHQFLPDAQMKSAKKTAQSVPAIASKFCSV